MAFDRIALANDPMVPLGIGTPADLISQPFFAIRNEAPRFMLQSNTQDLFRRAGIQ